MDIPWGGSPRARSIEGLICRLRSAVPLRYLKVLFAFCQSSVVGELKALAQLIYSERDVESSASQVLQCSNYAPVKRRILKSFFFNLSTVFPKG